MKNVWRALLTGAIVAGVAATAAFAATSGPWGPAQKLDEVAGNHPDVNTPSLDGCPISSPDGLSLYIASNRPGGRGGLDVWVATRASTSAPYGAPVNLGEPVNSAADDFCPTPVGKNGLFFLSTRTVDMHVRNMLTKLGCRSRTEATGRAHELGLLETV